MKRMTRHPQDNLQLALTGQCPTAFITGTSLLFVSTAGREAGSSESASAFIFHEAKETPGMVCHGETSNEEESAERPFGPQSGQASPTLGANPTIPKKKRPACAGRRSGDVIPGGAKSGSQTGFYWQA